MNILTLGDQAGIGDCVVFKMDFVGFESVEGMILMSPADCEALAKVGGLINLGHGEKFTLFELRLEVPGADSNDSKDEVLGVETVNGDAIWLSSVMREAVLGGVGGRAEKISTMIKLRRKLRKKRESR